VEIAYLLTSASFDDYCEQFNGFNSVDLCAKNYGKPKNNYCANVATGKADQFLMTRAVDSSGRIVSDPKPHTVGQFLRITVQSNDHHHLLTTLFCRREWGTARCRVVLRHVCNRLCYVCI